MKSSKAFWAGVLGALMMVIVMWMGRTTMGMTMSLAMMLGTMFLTMGSRAWILGLFMHLAIGGVIGLVYALAFERLTHKADVWTGVALGFINALLAGLVMGILPAIHPRIPESMPAPGYFLWSMGMSGVVVLVLAHLLYGAIVGGMYGPVMHPPTIVDHGSPASPI